MSAKDEIKAINEELANDKDIESLAEELDLSEAVAIFADTPAGKATVVKLRHDVYQTINELFEASRNPDLPKMLGIVARLEANIQMLTKFVGAKWTSQELLEILQDTLKKKSE